MLIDPNKTLFINSRGPVGAAVKEAPVNGKSYVRKDGGWSEAVIMSESGALLSAPHLVWKVQNVLFSNELQINISEGNVIIISALTDNITHKVPLRIPAFGTRVIYYFTQDPTGGRTITWSTAHKGIVSTTGGNNSQQLRAEFESTGTELIFVSSSGWY